MYTKAGKKLENQVFLESMEELKLMGIPFDLIQHVLSGPLEEN